MVEVKVKGKFNSSLKSSGAWLEKQEERRRVHQQHGGPFGFEDETQGI